MNVSYPHQQAPAPDQRLQQHAADGQLVIAPGVEVVRRWGTAAALLLAPLLILAQELLTPIDHEDDTAGEMLAILGDQLGRYELALVLFLAGMALMLPATMAVVRLIGGRGAWLGLAGGWITAFSLLMFCVNIGAMGLALTAIADLPAAERTAQSPGVDAILDLNGAVWVPAMAITGLFLGPMLLAGGLWRARATPFWVALLVPVGWWLFLIGPSHTVRAVGPALLFVALAMIARRLLQPGSHPPS